MDSWTLQGDSYSFLRSAPRNFSLCHRDGTPNHVEIFDIINVPSQSSAISETTCLCDIFGDDCDPPAVSSSPVVEAFVPSQREVDGTEASSPLVDDQNDSSGSYHTAEGSSGEEEEDPTERLQNPLLQSKSSERKLLEGSKSKEKQVSPELKNRSYSQSTQASSFLPELRGRVSLPDLFNRGSTPDIVDSPPISPSSDLLSAASLAKSGTRILSPGPLHKIGDSAPSELFTQVSSPVASYSLSPSPGVRSVSSIHTASSPEIRITASSPEVGGREQSPEVEAVSDSPLLYPQFEFASSRSPTSSPQITGISYSVVQPEDRDSPPFPELCCLSTPESDRTRVYPEARSSTPSRDSEESSRADSAATPRDSPHESGFTGTVQQPEITLSHQSRYQTPSPQPKNLTPSPESRNVTPSSDRARFTENMAHHVKERRTPSPPITRFTPVHILAPEKPYRPWQNRGHPQVEASSQSIYLKKEVTNRESPEVVPVDNNSQPHWVRLGKQLEMERKMLLEEEREIGRERERDREMEVGKNREGRELEKGEEWQGNESYRGEQVELSFNARNRKGLGSRSTVPTSRETRPGLPTVHSYSESLLATRQLQQQQSLLKFASQQDAKGGLSRRLQPPASQNKNSARVVTNRPCRSSSSSMGSEFDEADNEVKWFTDLAFSSLSRPEVDYLDMYNSSHRSSTNISQSSTQESPAGVSAAWPAYADFRGSAPKLDNDELSFQQPSAYFSDGLDSSRRYELGSFECIDVAVEREDKKVRRGVPKRQIQLRRKDSAEGKQDANSENSSPGAPAMGNSPFLERHSREALLRQYSTPEAMQEVYPPEHSPEPNQRNERKCKLQKSASLDETCTKTKMATCLIKSVLSKKMQSLEKQPDEQMGDEVIPIYEENILPTESEVRPFKESPKPDTDNLSSSFHSDYGLTSESLARSGEQSPKDEARPSKCFGIKSSSRPSSSSSNRSVNLSHTGNKVANSEGRKATSSRSEIKSELKVPFDSKHTRAGVLQTDDIKTWEESKSGDSANAIAGNTQASFASGASSMQARMTNRHQEFETIENHKKLQQMDKDQSQNKPKTQGISLKGGEKKKASLSVCLTPEAENKPIASSPDMFLSGREERVESDGDVKTDEEDRNADNKVKVIHKVRDVRRLVKNTYNLSFKATGSTMPSDMGEETTEHFNEENKEKIEEERQKDVLGGLEREITKEEKKEEVMVERKVEQKMEMKDEKPPTASPLLQTKGKSPTHPQPMQIQYKAVCCKDDKNKVMPSHKASEKQADESHISPELSLEASREQEDTSDMNVQNTTKDMKANSCKQDSNIQVETHEPKTETYKVLDNVEKPVVVRTDRKPPMLGSLPKLPSKEREVSTAVVLIRDGSSKTKTSASPAQEEIPTPLPTPAASESPELTTSSSGGHSVSMLLKEKGYQADIGAVVGDGKNASGVKGVPYKHVNCLEIPLQTTVPSDSRTELHRERTFSSSSTVSGPSAVSDNTDTPPKREDEEVCIVPTETDKSNEKTVTSQGNMQDQTQPLSKYKMEGDFEAVKRQDPTFPPRSPAIRRFRPQPIEVKSLSKDTQKQETAINNMVNNRPQTIEVKSIAKSSEKPVVPPKPTCKFKPADLGAMQNKPPKLALASSTVQTNNEERSQTIVVSSPTIYRKISNESNSSANYTRKIAVSAVSSLKPSPSKLTATAISSLSNKAVVDPEASNERSQQQHPGASPQSARYTHRPTTVATTPVSAAGQGGTSAPGEVSPKVSQVPELQSPVERQAGQPAVADPNTQLQSPKTTFSQEQVMSPISNNPKQPVAVSTTKAPGYTPQQCHGPLSSEYSQRTNDMRVYASDDPPSYDDRESFSPLTLPDLTPRRSSRYQPSSRLPPCSCTAVCPPNLSLPPSHYHRSPHNLTPPAPPHSPGHALPYPVTQPPLRPHQCRADTQPMNFQPSSSPKSSPLAPNQQSAMYQPVHQPPPCPPHHSLMQACPADRPMQPIDPRRPPAHRSPQQQPPGIAPYSDPGHTHSPGLPPMDPQYLCGPQSLGQSYGSEYGGDTSSLYSESNYGQTPRRVLLDPETGKYFYIEVPMQPLRKMLFDPETGQYVEVLIPQQAMSHSGLYPPTAAPYPSLHNPNMYAPAPQYMPYAAPPPSGHPQTQPQPPRYPEASAAASMHPNGPGVSYRNSSGQGSKPEPPNHPPLDQSYLESMYYVPTGMNASPNTTPPVYYHKHPPNLPPTGGKRS
ncbi:uncharacterized protein ACBR49_007328 [Aulostomus maculatus]